MTKSEDMLTNQIELFPEVWSFNLDIFVAIAFPWWSGKNIEKFYHKNSELLQLISQYQRIEIINIKSTDFIQATWRDFSLYHVQEILL